MTLVNKSKDRRIGPEPKPVDPKEYLRTEAEVKEARVAKAKTISTPKAVKVPKTRKKTKK